MSPLSHVLAAVLFASVCFGAAVAAPDDGAAEKGASSAASKTGKRKAPEADAKARPKQETKSPYGQNPSGYVLTFDEEFDRFDHSVWNDTVWYEPPNPNINYAVEDGMLMIWPQRDARGKFFNRTIDTDRKFYQRYGYFEMEARLPRGKGTWPAFWLFNHIGERRPEIDIMEAYAGGTPPWGKKDAYGVHRPTAYGVTIWHDKGKRGGYLQYDARMDLSREFHKYAVKWEPDRITFYFDGKQVYSSDDRISDPLYILVDLWFGSDSGEPDESTPEGPENAFQIRYVRAWQFKDRN